MKIVYSDIPESTIDLFADEHALTMMVYERGKGTIAGMRYFAHFKDADVADRGMLVGMFGNGGTPETAIVDYAIKISEETLVIDGNREGERRIKVPRLRASPSGVLRPGEKT